MPADLRIARVSVAAIGDDHAAHIWTEDGQHFEARGVSHSRALLQATLKLRTHEAAQQPKVVQCDECHVAEGREHQTWCPAGPGAMYR